MDWLSRVFRSNSAPREEAGRILWLYVRCDRCGTPIAIRIDRMNDLTPDYDSGGYYLRKEMMDGKCFQLMYAELHFDPQGKETSREIQRGKFIERAEYEARI